MPLSQINTDVCTPLNTEDISVVTMSTNDDRIPNERMVKELTNYYL